VRSPPGRYLIKAIAANTCQPPTNVVIDATGAEFLFPETLGSGLYFVWQTAYDVQNFVWKGGKFIGHAFDPNLVPHTANTWQPNVVVGGFYFDSKPGIGSRNILFEGLESDGLQGSVIAVVGSRINAYTLATFAENITLRQCRFTRSGALYWDYGFLWQRLVWAYEYDENNRSMAQTYFNPTIFTTPVTVNGTRIEFDNSTARIAIAPDAGLSRAVCFYGESVDSALTRGRAYYPAESDATHIAVSLTPGSTPIALNGDGRDMRMMYDLQRAFYEMFFPYGGRPNATFQIDGAVGVDVSDCVLENSNSDAMMIRQSKGVTFRRNEIRGARMGALFIGDLSENVLVEDNFIDDGNGSRLISIDRSCKDVVVRRNRFLNGGRGCWIDQPRGIVIASNVFSNLTLKNTADPYLGRRSPGNGGYERWDPMYFTVHNMPPYGGQPWGPVTIVSNVIDAGTGPLPAQAIRLEANARDVLIANNDFRGSCTCFALASSIERVTFGPNAGILTANSGRYTNVVSATTSSLSIPHGLADTTPELHTAATVRARTGTAAPTSVDTTDKAIVLRFSPALAPGTAIDVEWSATLLWK
jgi:hypothetical protein